MLRGRIEVIISVFSEAEISCSLFIYDGMRNNRKREIMEILIS